MMITDINIKKNKKRGRPLGSYSFVSVSISELNNLLKQDAIIIVSRKFWETISGKQEEKEEKNNNIKQERENKILSAISIEEWNEK